MKIISDSSSNLLRQQGVDYATVPLKIIAGEREYVDDEALDVSRMMDELKTVKGKTHTSCPNVYEWKRAAGDATEILMITITGSLSGSYAAAEQAARELREEIPPRKVTVINSLSTGPEMQLLIEKMQAEIDSGATFEEVEASVRAYQQHTHLLFALQCMDNLARNGRVNPLVAKMAGFLGIHAIGEASPEGKLQMLHKPRGRQKAIEAMYGEMAKNGYAGGQVRIAHCRNQEAASTMADRIRAAYPNAPIEIIPTSALCSFYAEDGGLLVGYEDGK
ncbi:MAG: DegV family protein [Ruminococcaceae bacterium]|nr:DegV family protein [Oscillospiraceae bacterium]